MIHRAEVRPSVSRGDGFVIAVVRVELLGSGFRCVPVCAGVYTISLYVLSDVCLSDVSCLSACCVKVLLVWGNPSPIARTGTGNQLSGDWMRPESGPSIHLTRRPRPTVSMTRGRARSMRCCPRWFLVPSPSHVVDPSIGAAAGGGGSFRGVV